MGARPELGHTWPVRLGPAATAIGDVALRPLRRSDRTRWQQLRLRDEALIRRWDPTARRGWREQHSATVWREHRVTLRTAARNGLAFPFAITVDSVFAGQVTVAGVQRFPVHSGWVGYWVGSEFTGMYFDTTDRRRAWVNIQHPASGNDRTIEIRIPKR